MSLENKSVLVLGGAGGIGAEIVRNLIANGVKKLGVIDSADSPAAILPLVKNLAFLYHKADITDELLLRVAMQEVVIQLDVVDIIINSVGILNEQNPARTIAVNYGGVVNSTLLGIEHLRKNGNGGHGGIILNIASITALGPHFWLPIYAGSKHAVLGFTRSLANDEFFDKTGISFITVCPGVTLTPLVDEEAVYKKHPFPYMEDEVRKLLAGFNRQLPSVVGECVVQALVDAENGSVWQVENNRIEKLNIVDYPRF